MVRKIIQPWWIRKQIALTVARLPSWGLRCCRPKEPLSEPRRGEFRRRAANRRANRTGNAACQEIVFESSWRYILHISFLNAHLLALRTRSIPRSKELGQFRFFHVKKDVPFGVIGHSREFPITREIALSSQFTHYANCNPISHNLIISQLYYLRLSIYSQILSSNRQNGQRLPIHWLFWA